MKDQIALITGAGRGIGREIAKSLSKVTSHVVVTARSEDQLKSLAEEINAAGSNALSVVADLSESDAAEKIIEQVTNTWGNIDILVNNAGIGSSSSPRPLVDFDDDFWDLTFQVNVTAPYKLTKLVLPTMIEKKWGRIINISSINAFVPAMHGSAYVASKHAIAGLTKATAFELAGTGVTANAVCPGVTRSLMNDMRLEYDAQRLGRSIEQLEEGASPLGRRLEPEEIASLVVYLASDESRAINGQAIRVDGGRVMA